MKRIIIAAAAMFGLLVLLLSLPADGGSTTQFLAECQGQIGKQVEVIANGSNHDTQDPHEPDAIARAIVETGQSLSIPKNGIVAALAAAQERTGMQVAANPAIPESLELAHSTLAGDESSLGIFAMSHPGAGSVVTLMDPTQAAVTFYNVLTKLDDWRDLEPADAAAQVLHASGSYAQHVDRAELLYARHLKPDVTSTNVTSPTATPTTIPIDAGTSTLVLTTTPSATNPFLSLTAPSDAPDLINHCITALRDAPIAPIGELTYQVSGPGRAAAVAAVAQIGDTATTTTSGSLNGPDTTTTTATTSPTAATNGATTTARAKYTFDELTLVRYAIYQGSGRRVVLPETIADINDHGYLVDPTKVVPGDLVFTDFTDQGPTRVRIVVDGTHVVEARDGHIVSAPIPTGNVVIKRFI